MNAHRCWEYHFFSLLVKVRNGVFLVSVVVEGHKGDTHAICEVQVEVVAESFPDDVEVN